MSIYLDQIAYTDISGNQTTADTIPLVRPFQRHIPYYIAYEF